MTELIRGKETFKGVEGSQIKSFCPLRGDTDRNKTIWETKASTAPLSDGVCAFKHDALRE